MADKKASPALDALQAAHAGALAALSPEPPAWTARRRAAMAYAAAQGLPTTSHEDWKYTSLRALHERAWAPARPGDGGWDAAQVAALAPEGLDCAARLVFVDGHFQAHLSELGPLPAGAVAGSLAAARRAEHPAVARWLGALADAGSPLVALNEAFFEDGAFLFVPRGAAIEAPILLLHLGGQSDDGERLCSPRDLFVLEDNAQATLIERHVGGQSPRWSNAVTELHQGPGATLRHLRLLQSGPHDVHLLTGRAVQERDSRYSATSWWLGGGLTRHDLLHSLQGTGADCEANGAFLGRGQRHLDNRTVVDHAMPHGSSRQLCKFLLTEKSRGVFQGKVIVRQDAQKTNAQQRNQSLVLSPQAVADTRPQLEIYADDVRCTHGATVGGELDGDGLFYLRSRGLSERASRQLLARAFLFELAEAEAAGPTRAWLEGALEAAFAGWEV
jgi:Fe-S cluster assembly protein SufD